MFVGTQILPRYLYERGAADLFDEMHDLARINAVLIFPHTITGYMYRREHQIDEKTGKPVDEVYVRSDPKYYADCSMKLPRVPGDTAYGDRDVLDEAIEAGKSRGMDIYARILEPYMINDFTGGLRAYAEVDQEGNERDHPCFNHPEYLRYVLACWEDILHLHPGLKGIKYGQERGAPLGPVLSADNAFCFCDHCQRKARESGYDLERAKPGWAALKELGLRAKNGDGRPADGWMASILRIFMRHPEILAHHRLWQESREDHRRAIYKLGKTIDPELSIGWHIDHHWCWDILGRAAMDFADMAPHSDWLSIALYFDAAGKRMAGHFSGGLSDCLFGDMPTDLALEVYRYFGGQNPAKEPKLDAMRNEAPLSADHVYAETKRAVDRLRGTDTKIYARVGFDLPGYDCGTTPQQVEDAVTASLKAGAHGLFMTREYGEVQRENLLAARKALDAFTGT